MELLAVAAPDVPLQHLFARLVAEVGVENVAREAAQGIDLCDARERRDDAA